MKDRQEVLIRLNQNKNYKEKIRNEFCISLPENEKAELVYHALMNERQLYIYYTAANAVFYQANRTSRVVYLISEWEKCTLECNNYQSFIQFMEDFFVHQEVKNDIFDKLHQNFSLLFLDPTQLENGLRNEMLILLCRVNAFNSLRLFLKLHYPAIKINFPQLLREAIGCLHSQSVQTLVEAGANIRDYFCSFSYRDYGINLFTPPLYYAIWTPFDNRCVLNRSEPKILWDNAKLHNMVKVLLSLGADPEQNCLVSWSLAEPYHDFSAKKIETDENTISFAREIITNKENIQKLNKESWDFLSYVAELKKKTDLNPPLEQKTEENPSFTGLWTDR